MKISTLLYISASHFSQYTQKFIMTPWKSPFDCSKTGSGEDFSLSCIDNIYCPICHTDTPSPFTGTSQYTQGIRGSKW